MPFIGFSTRGRGDFSSLKIPSLPQLEKSILTSTISDRKITLDQIPLQNQNQTNATLLHYKRDLFKVSTKWQKKSKNLKQTHQKHKTRIQNLSQMLQSSITKLSKVRFIQPKFIHFKTRDGRYWKPKNCLAKSRNEPLQIKVQFTKISAYSKRSLIYFYIHITEDYKRQRNCIFIYVAFQNLHGMKLIK